MTHTVASRLLPCFAVLAHIAACTAPTRSFDDGAEEGDGGDTEPVVARDASPPEDGTGDPDDELTDDDDVATDDDGLEPLDDDGMADDDLVDDDFVADDDLAGDDDVVTDDDFVGDDDFASDDDAPSADASALGMPDAASNQTDAGTETESGADAGPVDVLDASFDPCPEISCGANGTCEVSGGVAACTCSTGYYGDSCELACPCPNGVACLAGVCQCPVGTVGPDCTCPAGFTGPACADNVDDCTPTACSNGGLCVDGTNAFTCNCTGTGFSGTTCQTPVNDCTPTSCANGGLCVDGVNSTSCNCTGTGFSGPTCQTNVDDCVAGACQNGGDCIDGINTYSCDCTGTGFSGTECQTNVNDCTGVDCNNGTCVDEVNGYHCECDANYSGTACDVMVFQGLGQNPLSLGTCEVYAISGDGTTIVGTCLPLANGGGFKWVNGTYSMLPGTDTSAWDVSHNGLRIVGTADDSNGVRMAASWTGTANPEILPPAAGDEDETTQALFVSANGSVVAGTQFNEDGDNPSAVMWSGSTTATILDWNGAIGPDEQTQAMSHDGTVIVGYAEGPDAAWIWEGNVITLAQSATPGERPSVTAVNGDGSIIAGNDQGVAARWLNGSVNPTSLGFNGTVSCISSSGTILAGNRATVPYRWTSSAGVADLDDLLVAAGGDLTGWTLTSVVDMSADGTVIIGEGQHNGIAENWIARLP